MLGLWILLSLLVLWTSCSAPVLSSTHREGEETHTNTDNGGARDMPGGHSREGARQPLPGAQNSEQCLEVSGIYKSSIPAGETDVDFLQSFHVLASVYEDAVTECVTHCCKLGRDRCQYAWLFADKCFTIGCTKDHAQKCRPMYKALGSSIYVALQYSPTLEPVPTHEAVLDATSSLDDTLETIPTLLPAVLTTTPLTSPLPSPSTLPPSPPHDEATPPTNSPTHPPIKAMKVSLAGEWNITLPVDSTHLFSSTWPKPRYPETFGYKWEKVSGPSEGTLHGIDKNELEVTGLVAGVYVLKLTVRNSLGTEQGEATMNVTVHLPLRENTPPTPVISPAPHTTVTLPSNSALFDASGSHDDLGFDTLRFHWEEETGPVDTGVSSDSPVLEVTNLKQGKYKYKLTVTDADGLSAVAYATVTVNPEPYYPPQASAGKDQLLKMPNDEVTLDGSKSVAFKGDLQYRWEKLLGPGAVDMKGSNTPKLHLIHISSVGDYLFRLTVTDSQGQSSSANVSVVVLPEHNLPPEANAGPDQRVVYPNNAVQLNGSNSNDDYRIDSWAWTQLSGPADVVLSGENSPLLEVKGLHIDEGIGSPTLYQFQLCVWDYHNLTDAANVTVVYRKDPKIPPHVSAGGPVNITLPQNTVVLNGSGSYDDFGITSYQWVRSQSSPAAGLVMDQSDQQAVLTVSDLVEGTYHYTLTVTSKKGIVASDEVTITVQPNPVKDHLLEVHIEGNASSFTLADQKQLERVLKLILDDVNVDYDIIVEEVLPIGPHISVEFYAIRSDDHTPMNATLAYTKLTDKGQDYYYPNSNFHFVKINMKVCRLRCSGHGSCNRKTNQCSCNRYWMENPFKANFGKKVTNCEWSIFYVALGVLLSVAAVLFLVWLTCCCCMRKRRISRAKRRVRYAILTDRKNTEERRQMLPHNDSGYQQTSLMVSDSGTEEEEVLFQTKDEIGTKNGTVPHTDVKIRSNHKLAPNGSAKIGHSGT